MKCRGVLLGVLFMGITGYPVASIIGAGNDPATPPASSAAGANSVDSQKNKDIREFLEASGISKLGVQVLDQMIAGMKQTHGNVPNEFWDEFRKQASADDFTKMMIPIYAQHFSDVEIKQLTAFYRSPLGQKLVKEQPAMVQESMRAGQRWGFALGSKIAKQLQEKTAMYESVSHD